MGSWGLGMTEKFAPLDAWLSVDTWYTAHPSDDERFYKAVYALLVANRETRIDAADIRNYVESRYKGQFEEDFLSEVSQLVALRFEAIYEFCNTNELI